jgi:hypothetical protein
MTTRTDPLPNAQTLDRLFYATGVLLDAADFEAEQSYHRGRLARALAYLHGTGTVAGLEVEYALTTDPATIPGGPAGHVEQLVVHPGLAIDRLGRLIEVPRAACLRLDQWYDSLAGSQDQLDVDALIAAHKQVDREITGRPGDPFGAVVADVFLRFAACDRGKTPAFASGPFDALNAVQPSRVRDAFDLDLVLRPETIEQIRDSVRPRSPWPNLAALPTTEELRVALRDAMLAALSALMDAPDAATRRRALETAAVTAWPDLGRGGPIQRALNDVLDGVLEGWPDVIPASLAARRQVVEQRTQAAVGAISRLGRVQREWTLQQAVLNAWPKDPEATVDLPEYAELQTDRTSVFLARVVIRANAAAQPGEAPTRPTPRTQDSVYVDNALRLFVYTPRALAAALSI